MSAKRQRNPNRRQATRLLLLLLGLVAAALAVASCSPDRSAPQSDVAPQPLGLRSDAPTYALHGAFWVGYDRLTVGSGEERLEVDLWYPARNPSALEEAATYPMQLQSMLLEIPGWPTDLETVVRGKALEGAPLDRSEAPYPLIVFSHGFGLNAAWYSTLLEHFASHGFVVVAPQHEDPGWEEAWKAAIDRPQLIPRVLDLAASLTASSGDLAGLIDMESVAVVGHSIGGTTALAVSGAQFDLDAFEAHAASLSPEDPGAWILMPFVGKGQEMAARAGLDREPEGLWPTFADPRIDAIVSISSDAFLFDERGLSMLALPLLSIGGTADTGAPYAWGTLPAYQHAESRRKALVGFDGAEHMFVSVPCDRMPWIEETPFHEMFCFDPAWEKDRALDLIHHFSTAFLLDVLGGNPEASAALRPSAVAFDGIIYETPPE